MSKPVRLKDYLAAELEKMAARENRSLANLVNHLLEQAIMMEGQVSTVRHVRTQQVATPAVTNADAESRDVRARTVEPGDVQPDFKPERKKK